MLSKQEKVISKLDEKAKKSKAREEAVKEQYKTLYRQHLEMQQKLDYLHEQEAKRAEEAARKELLKEKKKNRKKNNRKNQPGRVSKDLTASFRRGGR